MDAKGWRVIECGSKYTCEHTGTWDRADDLWSTREEAQAWADETNKRHEEFVAANKRKAAERKSRQAESGPLADQFYVDPDAH